MRIPLCMKQKERAGRIIKYIAGSYNKMCSELPFPLEQPGMHWGLAPFFTPLLAELLYDRKVPAPSQLAVNRKLEKNNIIL